MTNSERVELLIRLGQAMFGKNWKTELARQFAINDRSVRGWVNEERPLHMLTLKNVLALARTRSESLLSEIDSAASRIEAGDGSDSCN